MTQPIPEISVKLSEDPTIIEETTVIVRKLMKPEIEKRMEMRQIQIDTLAAQQEADEASLALFL